jgi:Protein of unknown function (DUF3309)
MKIWAVNAPSRELFSGGRVTPHSSPRHFSVKSLRHEWQTTHPKEKVRQRTTAAVGSAAPHSDFERTFMLGTVLVILLVLLLIGALPTWPHSRSWGYGPTGGLGLVLVILIILLLLGKI